MSNIVLCLMGPTASGKTGLACELIEKVPCALISVDSAMIYRGMDIGTAKPSAEELQRAPHHLIDIKNPDESYSAAQFCTDATSLCAAMLQRGITPLLVGGTMMYFKALQEGLSALPDADESLRMQLEAEASAHGLDALYQKLRAVDPVTAQKLHAHDAQRIQRALEVYYLSGTPMSVLRAQAKEQSPFRFVNIALFPEQRGWLHERIAQRFDAMLDQGFIEEVQGLRKQWQIDAHMPSMRCVGYRQALEYLEGGCDYATMREKGIAATRQLAKRQLTWLRHWDEVSLVDPQSATFGAHIIAKIQEILDNNAS